MEATASATGGESNDADNILDGGAGRDTMTAKAEAAGSGTNFAENRLDGGDGRDALTAEIVGAGRSVVRGGAGNDTMTVIGGTGNVLEGGAGRDRMTGSANADEFLYVDPDAGNLGFDTIFGFQQSTDVVKLMGYGAGPSISGNVATLDDGTRITFDGLASIDASDFLLC